MDFIFLLLVLLIVLSLFTRFYKRFTLAHYSSKWEYFIKAFLYGVILVFTLWYGKDSLNEVSPFEWTLAAVAGIEGLGNYIQYLKEKNKTA